MKKVAAICAAVMLCTAFSACESTRNGGGTAPAQTTAQTTVSVTTASTAASTTKTTTSTAATTLSTTSAPQTTASSATATSGATSAASAASSTAVTGANPDGKPVKILWSERGLEAQKGDSAEGYGEPMTEGTEYLEWKLERYDGTVSGNQVSELNADFSREKALSVNGIVTVLPASHAEYPGKLYLRVDNQSEFPYFPADKRERGYFAVENTDEVWEMLGEENPPAEVSLAVTFSVDALHIHYGGTRCDTIKVSAAAKR